MKDSGGGRHRESKEQSRVYEKAKGHLPQQETRDYFAHIIGAITVQHYCITARVQSQLWSIPSHLDASFHIISSSDLL